MPKRPAFAILLFILCFLTVAFGAMDSVLAPSYLPEILDDLGLSNDPSVTSLIGAWINFSFLIGGSVGGILLSVLSDRVGCRKILALSLLLYGVGSGLGAFASSWQFLAATRFLVGTGVGAALVVTVVILANVWSGRSGVILGILSVAYPVGIICSGLITAIVTDWTSAFVVGAVPALLALPVYLIVPEISGRSDEPAISTSISLGQYHKNLIAGVLIYGSMLIGLWAAFSWLPTWIQHLADGGTTIGLSERGLAVILLGMGGLIGGVISGWLADRLGAWRIQFCCFIICLLLSLVLFKLTLTFSIWVLIGSGILGFAFGVSQGVLNAFIPALFPEAIRASATGICFHTGRVFTAIAVFFVGAWAIALGGYGNAIFTFSIVYAIGLIAMLMMKKNDRENDEAEKIRKLKKAVNPAK